MFCSRLCYDERNLRKYPTAVLQLLLGAWRRSAKQKTSLKAPDQKFAVLLARGLSQSEAYRRSRDCKGIAPARINERACRLAARPQVQAMIRDLLRDARIADIDSVGQAHADLLADMEAARRAENWTALAAFTRVRTQILGMIRDTLVLTSEQRMSDDQLIKAFAGEDEQLAAAMRAKLATHAGFNKAW